MKTTIIFILTLSSANALSQNKIIRFCKDINVVLLKRHLHNQNIQNLGSTRTIEGGPYKRKIARNCADGFCEVQNDKAPPSYSFEPSHPDANSEGYVARPSYNAMEEMEGLIKAQRVFEELLKNKPFTHQDLYENKTIKECFRKYKYFKEYFDLRSYLGS